MASKAEAIIKEVLQEKNLVTEEELAKADYEARAGGDFVQALIRNGAITEEKLNEALAGRGIVYVNLATYPVNSAAVSVISEGMARKNLILPIDFEGEKLIVATADPSNIVALDDIYIMTGYEVKPVLSTEGQIIEAINEYFKMSEAVQHEVEEIIGRDEKEPSEIHIEEDAPIIKLVNSIITRAVNDRASDIHIEPQETDLRVRYRIDGVLHEVLSSPRRIQAAVISRIKIMAGLDIAESRKPQDGHCGLSVGGQLVDFRVATLPTIYGERVVLRILRKESVLLRLEELGFLPDSLERFRSAFTKPYGAILVTGPTGSGKSTTLYATLNVLNQGDKNIVTIEDPVEYRLPGVNQVQIDPRAGLTFSKGLKAMLRTSPDILMVGEIRDRETAQIAIEAALTGHLVLSTLHTNDAPSAITRLTEMGIAPFLTASAIQCVQAQRLARRLCQECKTPYRPSVEALKRIGFPLKDGEVPVLYKAKGCVKCNNTGYKGRIGIYEVMLMSEEIERLAVEMATADQIKKIAIEEGMRTLLADGLEKAKQGITSIEEVMRVVV
jgi:type IV pilus assembly protein PilB